MRTATTHLILISFEHEMEKCIDINCATVKGKKLIGSIYRKWVNMGAKTVINITSQG